MKYTDEYYGFVSRKTRVRLGLVLGLTAVIAGLAVVCCVLRWKIPLFIVAGAGAVAVMFIWSMKLTPWLRYNRFMKDMRGGQKRTLEVTFISISPETRFYDGVEVHDISTRVGDREEDERLYVYDADMPLPELKEGQKIKVTSFGSFVVDIEPC